VNFAELPDGEQKRAYVVVVRVAQFKHRTEDFALYNPWNAWFYLSTQPARIWAGTLRGIAEGSAKAQIDRTVTENVGATEARNFRAAKPATQRVAKKASAIAPKPDRRVKRTVQSSRAHHGAKVRKRGRSSARRKT
jgi:hypothetical protein